MIDKFLSFLKIWCITGFIGCFGFGIGIGHIFNLSVNFGSFIMLIAVAFGFIGIVITGGFHG